VSPLLGYSILFIQKCYSKLQKRWKFCNIFSQSWRCCRSFWTKPHPYQLTHSSLRFTVILWVVCLR